MQTCHARRDECNEQLRNLKQWKLHKNVIQEVCKNFKKTNTWQYGTKCTWI